jgi:hypothetical protein
MNYFLMLVILGMCGGFYYIHQQDQQQIALLQSQLDATSAKGPVNPANAAANAPTSLPASSTPPPAAAAVAVLPPDNSHSAAIDSAAQAAAMAQNPANAGTTITTLDGRTFQNCKILKVETDGITFSHADGITKILFPLLPIDMQKKYGYDPHAAAAQTAAQLNYQDQVQQATATVPATTGTNQ